MSDHEVFDDHDPEQPWPPDAWTVEFTTDMSSGLKRFPTEAEARVWAEHYTEQFGATTWTLPTTEHQEIESDAGMPNDR